jgi:glycosyltransferase involved in cell wall biosynthesis
MAVERCGPPLNQTADRGRRIRVGADASRGFEPLPTGTERYARAVLTGLAANENFDCTFYLRGPVTVPEGCTPRVLRAPRFWTHTRLALELALRPPNVLYVPAHVLPWYCPVPAVVTVHDLGYLMFPDAHPPVQRLYLDQTTRYHARKAARIVADSRSTRDDLVRHYGANPDRIAVAHLGVDESFFPRADSDVAALRRKIDVPHDAEIVLHVGTLQPRKNLRRLLEAFVGIAAERPAAVLVLAGGGGLGPDLRAIAERLGVERKVRFLGYIADSDLPALYSAAAVYALPSLYEGFGLTALEAMACGVPVVASNTSSLPEVVGDAGFLTDPLDTAAWSRAILALLADRPRAAVLADRGRNRSGMFRWASTVEIVSAAIESAARKSPLPAQ